MNESEKISEINNIAQRLAPRVNSQALDNLRQKAISGGLSLDAFREAGLALVPAPAPVGSPTTINWNQKEAARYSLARAVLGQLDRDVDAGFEREISRELEIKHGKKAEGFWIPDEAMTRNMVAGTGTLGGMVVQTDNLASQFVPMLRNQSQVLNLGARVINLSRQCTIPRQTGALTANWVGETTASTLSGIQLQQLTLTPQAISANVQYSKMLLMESDPSIDMILRDDIAAQLALAIDLAALHGSGSGQPTGIAGTTGIGTVALSANGLALGNTTAFPALVSLESVVAAANAEGPSMAYLMRPSHRGVLRATVKWASTPSPIFETVNQNGIVEGRVNGYKAAVTNQIATNLTTGTATTITTPIFFGNWNDVIVANFGSTDLVVDPYTAGANGVVRLYARRWVDVGLRNPESFCVLGGVLGG